MQNKPLESIKAEPAKAEPAKAEPAKAEPAKAEIAKAPSAVVVKKVITITCTKGKTTKKFSGANPKCPAGYRKR
jgi:hypothetical protein